MKKMKKRDGGGEYYSDASDIPEEYWSEEDCGYGSREEETTGRQGETPSWHLLQLDEKCAQHARWQIVRRKSRDELTYGQVHPYPSDEQGPTIKKRPEPKFYIHKDNVRIGSDSSIQTGPKDKNRKDPGSIQTGPKDKNRKDMWFQGFPNEEDYPEENGWRDEEEYEMQREWWHDVWNIPSREKVRQKATR